MSKLKGVWDVLAVFHGGDDAAFRAMVVAVAALRKKTRSSAVVGKTRGKRRGIRVRRPRSVRRCRRRPAEERCLVRRGGRTRGKRNVEAVVVADCGQLVVAVAALQKKTRSGAVGSGGEGGRGANVEVVAVAGRGQRVVALVALRKKTRSGAVGKEDAGQTSRRFSSPLTTIASLPSRPCAKCYHARGAGWRTCSAADGAALPGECGA